MHDTEAVSPALSHLAQIPEPNHSSVGMAQANKAVEKHLVPTPSVDGGKFSLQSSEMFSAANTEGKEEAYAGESFWKAPI